MNHHPARVNLRYVLTAFLTGAAVMIAEIAAARAIAPHFGTSIIVWTNVIGIILVALSLGYWIGGRLSERCVPSSKKIPDSRFQILNDEQVLGAIILAAGVLLLIPAFAVPVIADSMIGNLLRSGSGFLVLLLGSFFSVVMLFAMPIFLLGMVSPFLVKLACVRVSPSPSRSPSPEGEKMGVEVGTIAGKLYAISTMGSLIGTFLPTLVLLPTIGTRWTILSAAAVLIALGAALITRRRAVAMAGVVVLVLVLVPEHAPSWFLGGTVVAAAESRYQYLRIIDQDGDRLLVFNEGLGVQSVAVDETNIPGGYFSVIAALPALIDHHPVRVLILGNAGGTIGNLMQRFFPDRTLEITGVELDPAVTAITAAHFPPPPRPYPIVHADSRAFVRQSNEQYDMVVVDAYTNQLTIPPHLATVEFFRLLRERLAPNGVVIANVNAPSEESLLFRTIVQTVAEVFPSVVEGYSSAWNRLIIASGEPADLNRLHSTSLPSTLRVPGSPLETFLQAAKPVVRDRTLRIFMDDWAPLELMTDFEMFDAIRKVK
ncbi:fused MFS/spermidine synthase [Candidatus Uhrbacteria bacterium]|nr:fused MFS/spermidine synthase [Candidatus Uhrbacteria bacterium]